MSLSWSTNFERDGAVLFHRGTKPDWDEKKFQALASCRAKVKTPNHRSLSPLSKIHFTLPHKLCSDAVPRTDATSHRTSWQTIIHFLDGLSLTRIHIHIQGIPQAQRFHSHFHPRIFRPPQMVSNVLPSVFSPLEKGPNKYGSRATTTSKVGLT